jgi:molybdopterin synthase sulfur carrier subunit
MLKVLFFGQLKEVLNTTMLNVEVEHKTVADLRQSLQNQGQKWQENLAYGKALVAVNQTMASDDMLLKTNDEVAFFPPVTGG